MTRRFLKSAVAYVPANISLIFTIEKHPNPAKMGSRGVGFTVETGLTATVCQAHPLKPARAALIKFNGKPCDFPTVETVLNLLKCRAVNVDLKSSLPLGCGFGLSGASALATAYALNKLFKLGRTKQQLAKIAHLVEVKNKTGLGDVVNQYFGGFLIKKRVSSEFVVYRLPLAGNKVYFRIFGSLLTASVLANHRKVALVNKAGRKALQMIEESMREKAISLGKFFDVSFLFAKESGLLVSERVKKLIKEIKSQRGHASMIMLGNGVVADMPFQGAKRLIIGGPNSSVLSVV